MAARTVTFFRAKPGHYSLEGLRRCGALEVADIGITPVVLHEIAPRLWLNAPALWQSHLRRDRSRRPQIRARPCHHPGGRDRHRRGAAGRAWRAPGRSRARHHRHAAGGAGRLSGGRARQSRHGVRGRRCLRPPARGRAAQRHPGRTRLRHRRAHARRRRWRRWRRAAPVVLDADAITVFGQSPAELFAAIQGPALLTPHEGEFRRLFPDLTADLREGRARSPGGAPQRRHGAPEGARHRDRCARRARGHQRSCLAGLATAGAGDVLAGIAVGLMAQGLSAVLGRCGGGLAPWRMRAALRAPGPHRRGSVGQIPAALQAGSSGELTVCPARAKRPAIRPCGMARRPSLVMGGSRAGVVELVDTRDLGSRAARRGGSSPSARTRRKWK